MKTSELIPKSDVRQLIKVKRTEANKLSHPHARYNQLGRITCILCGVQVKSEFAWNAHVLGRTHKEREHRHSHSSSKRMSTGSITEVDHDIKISRCCKSRLNPVGVQLIDTVTPESTLSDGKNPAEKSLESVSDSRLPEGFFDDKYRDAKARNVPYKDKLTEEVELFQKEMVALEKECEVVDEKESELMSAVRELDEIDVQIQKWKRIEELQIEKETLERKLNHVSSMLEGAPPHIPYVKLEPHSSLSESTSEDEFYDFRKKNAS